MAVDGQGPERVNVRIFLAAYMITVYPVNVFEHTGELEIRLMASAKLLLETFEKILYSTSPFRGMPHDVTKSFPSQLFDYLRDFKAWKIPDEARLLKRIEHALVALYQARAHLPPDEPENSQLNTEFRTQISRLKEKMLKIGGAAFFAKFEADHPEGAFGPGPSGDPPTGQGNQKEAIRESLRVQGAAAIALSDRMTNEQLAHEILFNPAFQLTDRGTCCESEVARRVRESFHKSFWESLIVDLELSPPCYVRLLRVLIEVRDGLIEVAPPSEAARAAELLDMQIIKQQADAGVYDWAGCNALVASVAVVIRRAQSPRRDVEAAEKWTVVVQAGEGPKAVCLGLEFLLDRVNTLRIDAANTRLRLVSPVIRDHGVDYERGKFQDKISSGALTVERTSAWLKESRQSTHNDTLVDGITRLIASMEPLRVAACPETLLMDVSRICKFQENLVHVAQSVTLVMFLGNLTAERKFAADKLAGVAAALKNDASDIRAAVQTVIGAEMMTPAVVIAIDQSSDKGNAVYTITRTRVLDAIKTGDLSRFHDMVKPQVAHFLADVNRLIQINKQVHGATYTRILAED